MRASGNGRNLERIGATSVVNAVDSDTNWWTITLSDLTLLLLGFLVLWHASGKVTAESSATAAGRAAEPQKSALAANAPQTQFHSEVWQAVRNDWSNFIVAAGLNNDVDIESTHNEILLSLRDSVPFASGKAELRARALPVLEKVVATVLAHGDWSAAIGGHTDSLRIASAEFPSNWELSTARASRVARYLIEKGIHPARLSVQGYAGYRPRSPNSTPADRRANRRVEIRLFQELAARGERADR